MEQLNLRLSVSELRTSYLMILAVNIATAAVIMPGIGGGRVAARRRHWQSGRLRQVMPPFTKSQSSE